MKKRRNERKKNCVLSIGKRKIEVGREEGGKERMVTETERWIKDRVMLKRKEEKNKNVGRKICWGRKGKSENKEEGRGGIEG